MFNRKVLHVDQRLHLAGGPIPTCKQMKSVGNQSFVYYSDMTETACK